MKNWRLTLLTSVYIFTAVVWTGCYLTDTKYSSINYWYQLLLALIPLMGGVFGIMNAKRWGLFSSQLGRAVFFLSLGLITWGLGQIYWSYATIAQIAEVPYPSLADVGYLISWPLWTIGIIYLSKATGARFALKNFRGKTSLFLIPLLAAAASYYLLIEVARGGTFDTSGGFFKLFCDLAYPVGDLVILTIALLVLGLSFNYLGGRYKPAILLIIVGYMMNYVTDFSFSYTTTAETYYNGHWVDVLFPTVMATLSLGLLLLDPNRAKQDVPTEAQNEIDKPITEVN